MKCVNAFLTRMRDGVSRQLGMSDIFRYPAAKRNVYFLSVLFLILFYFIFFKERFWNST